MIIEQWFAENPLILYDYKIEPSDEYDPGTTYEEYCYDLIIGDLFYDMILVDASTKELSIGIGSDNVPMDQWYNETWLPLVSK